MIKKILITVILLLVVFFITCISTKKTTNLQSITENDITSISVDNRGIDSLEDSFVLYQKSKIVLFLNEVKKSNEVKNAIVNVNTGLIEVTINYVNKKINFLIVQTTHSGIIISYEDELWKTHDYRNDSIIGVIKRLSKNNPSKQNTE